MSGLFHPVVVLFVAAVILTLWNRLATGWWGDENCLTPTQLQQTISVVVVVSPGESIDPYLRLLQTARWPARIRLHVFKMLGPEELVDDEVGRKSQVRLTRRVGAFDRAHERMRLLRSGTLGSAYVLLLAQPVEAAQNWDEVLLQMLQQCPRSATAVLTAPPPAARVSVDLVGTFLCANKTGSRRSRAFAMPPRRPQPSLFATAQMAFGTTEALANLAPTRGVNVTTEDAVLSQALWMGGSNFYAPHASLFHVMEIGVPLDQTVRKLGDSEGRAGAAGATAVRTEREWAHFSGQRTGGAWSRRAQLGLTPGAGHEERYAKHGDALRMHGL